LHHAIDRDAADLLDLGAGDGLAIGDDGEGFERRLGEPGRTAFVADEGFDPGRELGLADELPGAGHAHEAVAALGLLVVAGEVFQGGGDGVERGLLEELDRGIFGMLDGACEEVLEFLRAERLLR